MYHVSHQGQQFGPYTLEQINEYLAQGAFDASSHVWDANVNGWVEIWQLPGVILPAAQPAAAQPAAAQPAAPLPPPPPSIHTDSGWGLSDVVLAVLGIIGIAGTSIALIALYNSENYSFSLWNIFAIGTWIALYFRIASAIADLFKKDRPSWEWTKTRVVIYSTALIGFVIMILIAWIIGSL